MHRSLGLWDATMIVAGGMIGSGIFIVSADMARTLGCTGWVLFLWVISGAITVVGALSYGELAGMMPKAGGQFIYIQRAWGTLASFLYGWTLFAVIQTGTIAAVAVAFAKYTAVFFPAMSVDHILLDMGYLKISAAQLLAIAMIWFLTLFNVRGIEGGKMIQTIFTSAKLISLLAIIVLGLGVGLQGNRLSENFQHFWNAESLVNVNGRWIAQHISGIALMLALGTAIIGPLFSSDAWNNVTFIAGEIKEPQRNIPRSLVLGTAMVTLLYFLANITYLSLLPLHGDANGVGIVEQGIQFAGAGTDRVGTAAASMVLGNIAVYVMAALIMVSTFGCNNGVILSGARVYYAMAIEKLFFKKAADLNKNGVPQFALMVQAVWASVLCLSGTYGDLLDYTIFAALIFYIVTIAGIFVLRKKEPNADRPYKVHGYPFLPILYIVLATAICLILLITKTQNAGSGLLIVMMGVPIYYWISRKRNSNHFTKT